MRDLEILCECPFCGKVNSVMVVADDYAAYLEGMLIQDALPYLSANEREMIKTGICDECWDSMFAGDEWEEDEDNWKYDGWPSEFDNWEEDEENESEDE